MMDLATAVVSTVLAISGPSGEPVPGAVEQRAQVRCRPAPYIISDRTVVGVRAKPHKAVLTGSRVPIRIYPEERRTRPCHLMTGPGEAPPKLLTIADTQ